ncbi:transferase 2, rSAM/selenodomain-associated [Monaibacterium marinum]|uniref:Transferase 2, rSAM/selenodomain-associated n=1 Tax=Pontivivens marinum TaxID=1690039 RepID=A0A2C9CM98_9RHOB|nr:TIGR04283 family arsenosugar biosynthesis glycosyltransferase [Monaibacterium marinum]SOH92310.1 transferase 2, rSAM/selenodomain-associated [Monaibacterium marinum]
MAAPISIVIPTLNAAANLGPSLSALSDGLFEGLVAELIFADGGSTDSTAEVADEVGARLITAPRGRGTQLAAGCAAAHGEWLLILHADTQLCANWTQAVRDHMNTKPDCAGWFRLRFNTSSPAGRLVAGWANLRARWFGLPYGDQGLLVRKSVYRAAGGYDEVPLMEDVALVRRLRLSPLDAVANTSAERYERDGWLRRGWRNLTTLALYYVGVSPERLAARYVSVK